MDSERETGEERKTCTFRQFNLTRSFECARGIFGEVVEDDGGGHRHGEGGVGVGVVGFGVWWD